MTWRATDRLNGPEAAAGNTPRVGTERPATNQQANNLRLSAKVETKAFRSGNATSPGHYSIFQIFDDRENTFYVEARSGEIAVRFIEETYLARVTDWHQLSHLPYNIEILVAYERKTHPRTIA